MGGAGDSWPQPGFPPLLEHSLSPAGPPLRPREAQPPHGSVSALGRLLLCPGPERLVSVFTRQCRGGHRRVSTAPGWGECYTHTHTAHMHTHDTHHRHTSHTHGHMHTTYVCTHTPRAGLLQRLTPRSRDCLLARRRGGLSSSTYRPPALGPGQPRRPDSPVFLPHVAECPGLRRRPSQVWGHAQGGHPVKVPGRTCEGLPKPVRSWCRAAPMCEEGSCRGHRQRPGDRGPPRPRESHAGVPVPGRWNRVCD